MFSPYTDRLIAINEMLSSPLQDMTLEALEALHQLILEYRGDTGFDKELEQIAKNHPIVIQELEARYQIKIGFSSGMAVANSLKDNFLYDVFISYSHDDKDWTQNTLLPNLENRDLKVCIDYRDFIAGKAAIINMQDASDSSRHTLLVMTPRWVKSEWTFYESILSRTDDPSGLQRRTVPLLLEKCTPPKFISMLTWVDFTNREQEDLAWEHLFKSLGSN